MKTTLISGLPKALQSAGWWRMSSSGDSAQDASHKRGAHGAGVRCVALAALLAAGDSLLWGIAPGLSLAAFVSLVFLVAGLLWPGPIPMQRLCTASALMMLSALPLVELVQPLSTLFLLAGAPLAFSILAGRPVAGAVRFWWRAPLFSGSAFAIWAKRPVAGAPLHRGVRSLVLHWGLPIGLGCLFAVLLVEANPVLEQALADIASIEVTWPEPARALMWLCLAIFIWPLLGIRQFFLLLSPDKPAPRQGPRWMPSAVNAGSVLRSLVLFNILFAVQNGLDITFIAAGVRLPDGMTFAEYAHRGAYALVLLALLSGAFALLARPFVPAAAHIRWLLLVWMVQTLWLTVSSAVRLDLYVAVYGLTHLRLAAAVWIAMVGAGLLCLLWYVWTGQAQRWVLRRLMILGALVLYGAAFVSFDRIIAVYNLTHPVAQDAGYVCSLGEAVVPVILTHSGKTIAQYCYGYRRPRVEAPQDWREWGFRNARVRRSLAAIQTEPDLK